MERTTRISDTAGDLCDLPGTPWPVTTARDLYGTRRRSNYVTTLRARYAQYCYRKLYIYYSIKVSTPSAAALFLLTMYYY